MIKIKMPEIKGGTAEEQVKELKSFLVQLVRDLNWAFSVIENNSSTQGKG